MTDFDHFELQRMSDDLIYQFDRKQMPDGHIGYQRRDADLWITSRPDWGWVAYLEDKQSLAGRPWNILPKDQGDHPSAGEWVSKKGVKSYVYELKYGALESGDHYDP